MHGAGGRKSQTAAAEIRRRAHEIVRFRMAEDISSLVRLFVEDVELTYNCAKLGLFPAGQGRGRDALRENLRRADIDYEPLDAEVLSVLVEGDRSAVRWLSNWRHRATGQIYHMDMAHFLRWRHGLVAEMSEFIDHHCVSRAPVFLAQDFEQMLSPRDPGLDRDEIARRMIELGNFSGRGPSVAMFREFCAPDVICEFVGDRTSISYAGRHRGIEALANIIRAIGVEFEQLGQAMPEVIVDGDWAAVRRTVEWRHRGAGRLGLVELADFARFQNGLIVEIVEFRDSVALLQMQD